MTDRLARLIDGREAGWAALAALACTVWYAALITGFDFHMLAPVGRGRTFNGMLDYMLHGRFDVPPGVIGDEGFARGGRVYAYFGIFPALLRLPLLAVPEALPAVDVTRLSTLLAAGLGTYWQLRAIGAVRPRLGQFPHAGTLLACLAVGAMLGGPQVQFLRLSLYQEVTYWGAAFAAMFVAGAARGWAGGFSGRALAWMALAAGLALITRVSTGLGLYAALGLLALVLAWPGRFAPVSWLRGLLAPRMWPAILLLAVFMAITLGVNWARWGNPLMVLDVRDHLMNVNFPDRLARVLGSGEFNPARIWFGVLYYFVPVVFAPWHGALLLAEYQRRMVEIELPPASFLVSDPLLLLLAGAFVLRLREGWRRVPELVALCGGLVLPAVLMLGLVYMNFRYRQEFYPLFFVAAFGALALGVGAGLRRWAWGLTAVGVVASHWFLLVYVNSPYGPATAEKVWTMVWRVMIRLGM